jgi:hypothetical protein
MYNTRPSDIHIICDDNAERLLHSRLDLVQNPLHHVRVWFYKPTWQSMLDRVEREGSIKTDHSAGLRESAFLLLPQTFLDNPYPCSGTYEALHP